MPINSIGRTQADTAGFIPIIWAQRALDVLRSQIVLADVVTRDTDFEPGWRGKTLNIAYPGTFVAQSKTEGNPATVQQPSNAATTPVTLSQHSYVDFVVEDWAQAQANSNLMDRWMKPAIIALAEALEAYLWGFASAMTSNTPVGTQGTALARATITAARASLNVAKVPMADRTLVIDPTSEQNILTDSNLQSYFAFAKPDGVSNGRIGMIDGFDVRMSQFTPVTPGANKAAQSVTIGGGATGGTFTLTYNSQTTGNIAFGASAATVQAALQALSSVGANGCFVVGNGPYKVIFTGTNLNQNTYALTGSASGLTGGTPTITIANISSESTLNLALYKEAILLATRPFADPPADSGVQTAVVVDPMSGLSIRMQYQYRIDYRGVYCGFDLLYGAVALRPTNGVIVLA